MAKLPIIPAVNTLTLLIDNDPEGLRAAAALQQRWTAAGRTVTQLSRTLPAPTSMTSCGSFTYEQAAWLLGETTTTAVHNGQEINLADFRAYLPVHNYIFMPCREPWPSASIDAVFPPQVLTDAAGHPVMRGGKVRRSWPAAGSTRISQHTR